MKNTNLFTVLLLFWSICLPVEGRAMDDRQESGQPAADQQAVTNINERYLVEGIAFAGMDKSRISRSWHEKAQKLVGQKYSEKTARDLASQLAAELKREYKVEVKRKEENGW